MCFSPRNGESVLKRTLWHFSLEKAEFQSPQWGKCSKGYLDYNEVLGFIGFSPRNGESVLKKRRFWKESLQLVPVSVPAMGKVF